MFRYFELESSGRKDEVRLHYVSMSNHRVHTEVFAYALADGHWHAVAVTLSGTQARLFIDCRLVYTRTLAAGPVDTSFTGSPDLFVGQRNRGIHSVFKVYYNIFQSIFLAILYKTGRKRVQNLRCITS